MATPVWMSGWEPVFADYFADTLAMKKNVELWKSKKIYNVKVTKNKGEGVTLYIKRKEPKVVKKGVSQRRK